MTSLGPLFTRNRVPPPNSPTLVPLGKYQLPRSVRCTGLPDSVPQQSTRSVIHCNTAPSLAGALFVGAGGKSPMFKTSSKSTKLSLGKVSPRNTRETPAACVHSSWQLLGDAPIIICTSYVYILICSVMLICRDLPLATLTSVSHMIQPKATRRTKNAIAVWLFNRSAVKLWSCTL